MYFKEKLEAVNRIKYLKGDYAGFICSKCGQETNRDESFSYRGYSLKCPDCFFSMRKDDPDALERLIETGRVIMDSFEKEEE